MQVLEPDHTNPLQMDNRKESKFINPMDSNFDFKSNMRLPRILSPKERNASLKPKKMVAGYSRRYVVLQRRNLDAND